MGADDAAAYRALLGDLVAEQGTLDAALRPDVLGLATVAEGWSVGDTVAHLRAGDAAARLAAGDPAAFVELRAARRDGDAARPAWATTEGDEDLVGSWRATRRELVAALARLEVGDRVEWFGPPMSARTFATARLMEYWAHGEDLALALGVVLPATDRLRHVCHLGVLTRRFSFRVHGEAAPMSPVLVELEAPGGGQWRWGDPASSETIRGPARDFCLVVTQRRHVEDTALACTGAAAAAWMHGAQAFAGPPSATAPYRRGLPV